MLRKLKGFFSRLVSKVRLNYSRKLKAEEFDFVAGNDLRGCIILTHTPYQLSNLFIFGEFKHVEICVKSLNVIGAITTGVRKEHILQVLKHADKYVVLKPTFLNGEVLKNAIDKAESLIGTPYDWEFELDNRGLYCSEVIVQCYKHSDMDYGEYLYPSEFLKDNKHWKVLFEFGR